MIPRIPNRPAYFPLPEYRGHPNLHENSTSMYKYLGHAQKALEGHCHNKGRDWTPNEKQNLRTWITNLWDLKQVLLFCIQNGRTPYSVFNVFVIMMFEDLHYRNDKTLFEKAVYMPEDYL